VICLWLGTSPAWSASTDADGTYSVTVTKIELSTDGGTTYSTIFEGSQLVNIASANAGAVVASLVDGGSLEYGVYDTVRTTIGANLVAKGYVNDGADTVYTDGSNNTTRNVGTTDTPAAGYDSSTFTIPVANRTIVTTPASPITCSQGVSPIVTVSFDTSGVLSVSGTAVVPGAPTVSIASR